MTIPLLGPLSGCLFPETLGHVATPEPRGHPSSASWCEALVPLGWGEENKNGDFFPEACWPQSLDLLRDKRELGSVGYFFSCPLSRPASPSSWCLGEGCTPAPVRSPHGPACLYEPPIHPSSCRTRRLSWTHLWFLNSTLGSHRPSCQGSWCGGCPRRVGCGVSPPAWPPSGGTSCPAWCLLTWLLPYTL